MRGFTVEAQRTVAQEERDHASAMLKAAAEVRAALDKGDKEGRPPALLLLFDATAPHGRAVVSYGDPDKAHHITTYVPGLTTQVENSTEDFRRSLVVWDQANSVDPLKKTASIAWLGYDAPQVDPGLVNPAKTVAMSGAAEKGSKELLSFVDGVHSTHDPEVPTHLTMVGHSYGSLTTGKAAAQRPFGTFADDLVFVGSPGVGVEQAVDLGIDAEHVWVGANAGDPIALAGWFTANPSRPEFGAIRFRTGGGGHSDYWTEHKTSLRNIGYVVTGKFEKVTDDVMILAAKQ
ncbi:alpha/beta hydrolase [Streptosporangium saharense]|uniref:alpha/beta hydrolase n=2 Tax=Streptosporangium saharense TaxID=1706840 RepID=UPI0036857EDF